MNNVIVPYNQTLENGSNKTLKTTSLLYLKEALSNEAYEECFEILKVVREFKEIGIDQVEIEKLLQEHISFLKQRDRKVVPFIRS